MPLNVKKIELLFLMFFLYSCSSINDVHHSSQPADLTLVVEQPFRENEYLATVRVIAIHECFTTNHCLWLKRKKNLMAHFVFTHKRTDNNLNFKALKEHFPGVKAGDRIRAYCIAERQKHGEYLLRVYQYTLL
ncbi:hypothetical protein [Schleiferia thermophila]|jgi:hypothetical protein|uniref:hypothetical protein n=1 Tax=Schleiferia thermophila TaxID=884107 RepID=UPI0004E7908F|nr:hypothetical protein [Schleiferia thermophila]KFD38161.1 hypothetical protein AT05_11550 [Schleiferia thermophila str. Yellowstone]